MTGELILNLFDWTGVFVFALSGGLMAVRQKFDILGIIIIAWLPAIGGGTLRDLLLGQPVFWLDDPISLSLATLAGLAAFFGPHFWARIKALVWVDAMGLALFAVVGGSKAASLGHGFMICTLMGAMTATAGGLLRDVVCNEAPLLLREEIYATAAIIGAAGFYIAISSGLSEGASLTIGAIAAFTVRGLSLKFKLNLPRSDFKKQGGKL
ncbi:trimeric intracellular cation channel family protein [Hellea balneolensis]|uniref:trimeric intracellular cation channel family protein n=1 Tax=Hellea balneolensis TaxID=287478 RepID=UPI00040253CA|nr:trimeric intracellular cation channel family protein [Hellea balneolensis]